MACSGETDTDRLAESVLSFLCAAFLKALRVVRPPGFAAATRAFDFDLGGVTPPTLVLGGSDTERRRMLRR